MRVPFSSEVMTPSNPLTTRNQSSHFKTIKQLMLKRTIPLIKMRMVMTMMIAAIFNSITEVSFSSKNNNNNKITFAAAFNLQETLNLIFTPKCEKTRCVIEKATPT